MPGEIWSRTISALAASLLLTFLAPPAHAQIRLDLPVQSLEQSLTAVGILGHLNVMFDPSVVDGLQAPALKAELSAEEALGRLLLGTKLRAIRVDANTIRVIAEPTPNRAQSTGAAQTGAVYPPAAVHLASNNSTALSNTLTPDDQSVVSASSAAAESAQRNTRNGDLEEIIITGTNITGVTDTASPISTYSRDDIDRAGLASVKELLQRIPQNFNGGASDGTVGQISGGGDIANLSQGTGVNLRGLGSTSSLVLLNGHRLATGNIAGDFVDISLIPLAALQRMEVVPDGASATYGSDAVGGVVNFITRKDFEGVEARIRYGSTTDGGRDETDAALTLGHTWQTGSALASYEYTDDLPLNATDRSYTSAAQEPFTLIPEQLRKSVFASLDQALGDTTDIFANALYSRRTSEFFDTTTFFSQYQPADTELLSATAGGKVRILDRIAFELSSTYSTSSTHYKQENIEAAGAIQSNLRSESRVVSIDPKFDGSLLQIPAGAVRFAIGGQYRRESLDSADLIANTSFDPSRTVSAAFLELIIPILGEPTGVESVNRLELSVAGRYEHYSDFGSTTNPKLGLIWRPWNGVKLRGTYGKSFRAPTLYDTNPQPSPIVPIPLVTPQTGVTEPVLFVFGGNPNLEPEKARTWTAGFDFQPQMLSNFKATGTYYDIRYTNRLALPSATVPYPDALAEEAILGPTVIQQNVSPARVQELIANPAFLNAFGLSNAILAGISTIGDYREQNLSSLYTRGLDFGLAYTWSTSLGHLELGIDGTHIFKFDTTFSRAPTASVLNTPYNPIDVRLRARAVIQAGPLTAAGFLNYTGPYTDNRTNAPVSVASWSTADLSLTYTLERSTGFPKGGAVSLNVTNVTNRAPPYVLSSAPGSFGAVNYDGANASPLGRFISIQVSAHM